MSHYSICWEKVSFHRRPPLVNFIQVKVSLLHEGRCHSVTKYYEEWIGVCTDSIESVVQAIRVHFPGTRVRYQQLAVTKKVLPYFEERLARGRFEYRSKPFFKVYVSANHQSVGRLLNRRKISYFDPEEWLVRLYLDFCLLYDTHAFYYRWYTVREDSKLLLDALRMHPEKNAQPSWTIAAIDLESVPMQGNHVPMGYVPTDRIVMASVVKWRPGESPPEKRLLYVFPPCLEACLPGYPDGFRTEEAMLQCLHALLEDVQVITGYNINAYDMPCLFARLFWLRMYGVLRRYGSSKVGTDTIVTIDGKWVVDLYAYFKNFSGYDLPSFKLDDVARVKLEGEAKLPVKAIGLWSWYRSPNLTRALFEEDDALACFQILQGDSSAVRQDEFGTFRTYMDYCLQDSELVYRLFEKEHVLSFLVERANFTALNVVEAMHLGNSRYLLELFKTYGFKLGYLVNPRFFQNQDSRQTLLIPEEKDTYQGALNYCVPESLYEDVSVMDFASMYPSTLLSNNLCYGTTTIVKREAWQSNPAMQSLTAIPYRHHSHAHFEQTLEAVEQFSYPSVQDSDDMVIVINPHAEAFLPQVVRHFIQMRRRHQADYKTTRDPYHYNVQLGIKILINSLYGVMASKESPLAYMAIAVTIVTLSRYQLLGSFHYLKSRGFDVCYADTDSLMVHRWPDDHCDSINRFLNLAHVQLQYEQRMKRLVVISKKRYVYETQDDRIVTKGFQKKINGVVAFMTRHILSQLWQDVFQGGDVSPGRGWALWTETLLEAQYRSRDPRKHAIYRKIKPVEEYKSKACPSVRYLMKYPDKKDEHVEFTYNLVDVAATEASKWVMDVDDCQQVNYEQLFISQKKLFCTLLNMAYWHLPDPTFMSEMVLNTLHWKRFVHAELLHKHATGRGLRFFVEKGVKLTFKVNNHLSEEKRRGRKRVVV